MVFSHKYLFRLARDIFKACGTPGSEAEIVAEHLVTSSLMGLDSHGIMRIPQYVNAIKEGTIRPGAAITILEETSTTAIVDAGYNFGQVGGMRAIEISIEKAKKNSVSSVIVRHSNHAGRLGAYPEVAVKQGFISMAMCSSIGGGHFVSPWGGREGRLATNPIAFAAPTKGNPILIDISTSVASEGKIRVKREQNELLPEEWILDASGNPSTNPKDFYGPSKGVILPLGGKQGYKGYAFSLMVEILAGILLGDGYTPKDIKEPINGLWLLVLDISAYMSPEQFKHQIDGLIKYLKSSPPADGFSKVTVPGELDFGKMKERRAKGIPMGDKVWKNIKELAKELGVKLKSKGEN